jgi:hypothetical protein
VYTKKWHIILIITVCCKNVVTFCSKLTLAVDQKALQALCLAWQWRKGSIKSKKAKGRKYCDMNERDCLEMAVGYLQEDYDVVKEQVYQQLVLRPRSSAYIIGNLKSSNTAS